jgi:cell division septation protein DedD
VPKNEDGEFELILANRQLLSVFFIVVVLLGVFFTMGYIVGRNSGPVGVDVASARKPEPKATGDSTSAQDTTPPASTPASSPAPTSTAPQREPEPVKPEPKTEETPVKKEPPAKKEKEKPAPAPASAPAASGQTYLQLAATAKAEANVLVDVLHQKQFKAIAVEIPEKPGIFRVLVGPLADGTLNKMKSDLTSAGFPGDKAIKKVY